MPSSGDIPATVLISVAVPKLNMISGEFRVRNVDGFARPWNSDGYAVYHGTGDYVGWTLMFRDISTGGSGIFESYILIPKSKLPT